MRNTILGFVLTLLLLPACVFAVDGVVLINQSSVMAAGGFPYVISQPGSYRLSGNLTVPDANTTAIFMNNDNISLDLNGFSILGPTVCIGAPVTSCGPPGTGIGVDFGSRRNISVRNGTVRGMGARGIAGSGGGSSGGQVENIHADSNSQVGIELSYGKVTASTATGNGFDGISGINSVMTGNTATLNGRAGIIALHSTVSGNVTTRNGQAGISASHSTVSGNTSNLNADGIDVSCPSLILGNTAVDNTGLNLFTAGTGCLIFTTVAP
jgi:hypothetical protein